MSQDLAEARAGYLIKAVQQLLRQACDQALRPAGLSMAQYTVLRALADHPNVSSAELARRCFVTRQSLRDVLGGLQAAGLVAVDQHAKTGRAKPVTLTPAGRDRLRAADRAVASVEQQMITGLSLRERDQFIALLTTCVGNLAATAPPSPEPAAEH